MKESEFIAADNLTLHTLDGKPSPNIKDAKLVSIKRGDKIPEIFIPVFLRRNRDYIANLEMKDGIPALSKDQEKKYNVKFEKAPIKTFKKVVDESYGKYTEESLTQIIANKGSKGFKDWAEKEFGEDKIDRRKSSDKIKIKILNWQDEGKI